VLPIRTWAREGLRRGERKPGAGSARQASQRQISARHRPSQQGQTRGCARWSVAASYCRPAPQQSALWERFSARRQRRRRQERNWGPAALSWPAKRNLPRSTTSDMHLADISAFGYAAVPLSRRATTTTTTRLGTGTAGTPAKRLH
jgi:hypothetical protein